LIQEYIFKDRNKDKREGRVSMGGKVHTHTHTHIYIYIYIYIYRMLLGKPKERDGFAYLNVDGKTILKWILKKQDGWE
jgi:hypothetical protein